MGLLLERIKLSNLVNGDGIADNYKKNSLYFYEKFRKSDHEVQSVALSKIQAGRFYFFHYLDDSNWMKYSPVFVISIKKFENLQIIMAINMNFVPLEVRTSVFDNVIVEQNFEKDEPLNVDFNGVYQRLRKYGFEYSICEYNLAQVKLCHKINMDSVPRFLYSGHPKNKYDARKLYSIWKAKLKTRDKRDAEMSSSLIKDFFDVTDDISNNYEVLRGHIQRLQSSLEKYGRQS
jgi:hypothetical protein